MFASVEAIFLSTFVLISQNRCAVQADQLTRSCTVSVGTMPIG